MDHGASRVVLVNTNEIQPPIAPIGLDYLAGALSSRGHEVDVLDLNSSADPIGALRGYFRHRAVGAVGVTFRNSDDCFWPSAASFVPRLAELIHAIRALTDAPVVLGGGGFSLFPRLILEKCDCEFGIGGDGETGFPMLLRALARGAGFEQVPGLVWRTARRGRAECLCNPPARSDRLQVCGSREWVDNRRYFQQGGQGGVETKRGCDRRCTYCADPLIKGTVVRVREPGEVAAEVQHLLRQGVDVLHLCDSEFNVPPHHARAVCEELIRRGLGRRVRWYTYASPVPFSDELARLMRRAGCVGINFGVDSASAQMLAAYGRIHRQQHVAEAVRLCRRHGLLVMLDLLLGGPGETEATAAETIEFMKRIGPDCVGAALGVRIYPGTALAERLGRQGALSADPNIWRPTHAAGGDAAQADEALLMPTFYISSALGDRPAELITDMIGGDQRFFAPSAEQASENYNYSRNLALVEAIREGARGAYWDILRRLRCGSS